MQRIEHEAAIRRIEARKARAITATAPIGAKRQAHLARLMLAGCVALAALFWVVNARAQGAQGGQGAQGADSRHGAATATPGQTVTPPAPASGLSGVAQAPAGAKEPSPAGEKATTGGENKANGSPAVDERVGPDDADTDEGAATLPEPEDGQARRGAEGPPPAPRGPSAYAGLPTLLPSPAEAGHIDEVALPKRAMAILSGRSSWDDGFKSLFDSFDAIAAELAKAGVKPAGRPLAVFVSTDENGFSFDAMAPVAAVPADASKIGGGVRFGDSPSGKAIRFTHKAPYEEIDTTYEAITAYLDSRNIAAQDAFIEEYVTDPKDPSDGSLQINIYVQPKPAGSGAKGQPSAGSKDAGEKDAGQAPSTGAGQAPASPQAAPPSSGAPSPLAPSPVAPSTGGGAPDKSQPGKALPDKPPG